MDFDYFNPIFVLHCQKTLRFLRKYGVVLLGVYSILAFSAWMNYESPSLAYSIVRNIFLIFAVFVGFFASLGPASKMAERTIEQDLILFTALTDQQVVNGYLLIGVFGNLLLCVGTFMILSLFSIGSPELLFQDLLSFTCVFLATQSIAIFLFPFFTIVQKSYQLVCVQLLVFPIIFCFFSSSVLIFSFISTTYYGWTFSFLFIITASLFGYNAAWRCRKWRAPFFQKVVLLIVLYVDYGIVFGIVYVAISYFGALR